jgi:anaerobic selenocysteine-containing dehydrogenase
LLERIHGACPHDCPDTCGVITEVEDGRAVRFYADPSHPIAQGWLCSKVRPYLDHVYHPDRLLYPMRRVGDKGGGAWKRISWAEAIAETVTRWREVIASYGAESILPYSYSGTLGLVQGAVCNARLWNRLGASQLERSICGAAAELAVESTLGARWSPPVSDLEHSQVVILWGHNPVSTAPHFLPFLRKAQHRGCRLVVIDPLRTPSAQGAELHLAPRPGTDGWLALGLAHVIVAEGLHDQSWLEAHALGWPEFSGRLANFPPARVAERTGLAETEIVQLARLYGTSKPGLIKMADGVNRTRNGGQNVRAICALPALTGQYGEKGGGLAYSSSGYTVWDRETVQRTRDCPPAGRMINMNRLGAALLEAKPPIQALYVFNANPVTSSPATGRIVAGLMRNDLFTVVHELYLTDTARYADIVLPATSQLEHADLHRAYGHTLIAYNRQAIAPRGECKSNWEVMTILAKELGLTEPWLRQTPDEIIEDVLAATARHNPRLRGMSLAKLQVNGAVPMQLDFETPFEGGSFPTPSGKVELLCPSLAEKGYDPLPGNFVDDDCSAEELCLVSPASHHFVSSSLAGQEKQRYSQGEQTVEIHSSDAAARGLCAGDRVRIENERGWFEATCVVSDRVRPGVAASVKGPWHMHHGGRGVNCTTSDELADLAGQSIFHSNHVRLRKVPTLGGTSCGQISGTGLISRRETASPELH